MSKSPLKDYTSILEQSRTQKKQDFYNKDFDKSQYDRYSYFNRRDNAATININNNSYNNDDIKIKLQIALRHNTKLLDQNSSLSQLANSLRFQLKNAQDDLEVLRRQIQDQLRISSKQRENLLMENQIKNVTHEQQLTKLLNEISTLHEEKNIIQIQKNKQIQNMKGQFQKSLLTQMQNIRNLQNNSKQLYEVQIKNLKQTIKNQQYDRQNAQSLQKLEKNRLIDQISAMQSQIKHLRQKFQIDIRQTKQQFEKDLLSQKKRTQNQKQIQTGSLNLKIKRLKKDLLDKVQDLQTVNKKMFTQQETFQLQSITFKKDKENLLSELTNNEINFKTVLMKQKTKLQQLSKLQVQNLTSLYETNIQQLQGQVNRLRLLVDCKTQQIKDTYEQNKRIKQSYGLEAGLIRKQNQELKQRLKNLQLEFREQQQTMKVKLAQLIEANIQQITSYYKNQLSNIVVHNRQTQKMNKDLKDRIYKLINENDDLRKNFEIQTSKHKARIQDLKIKLASISLQHKQHIGSLASKVQLTSQTLIREAEGKQKSKSFYEDQKRKIYAIINQKDKQISDMNDSLVTMRKMHDDQLRDNRVQRDTLRDQIERLQNDKKKIKQTLEIQIAGKNQKLRNLTFNNEKEIQQIRELQRKLQQSEKEKIKLQKKVDHLNLVNQSLAQELGLKKGFIQTLQLQSNAAIEEEKTKIRVLMGAHQISLKEFFEEKVKSKNRDIQHLQRVVSQKQQDIRTLIVKYNALQKRFDMAMDAQDKLTEFEQKIQNMGLDNNLVKNFAQLFKKKA